MPSFAAAPCGLGIRPDPYRTSFTGFTQPDGVGIGGVYFVQFDKVACVHGP